MNTATEALKIERAVHFGRRGHGARKELRAGPAPKQLPPGRVPRVARLLALALKFEGQLRSGEIATANEVARLGRVTHARVSQVMALLSLAPDIQENVLFLPLTERGRDPVRMRQLLPVARELDWQKQRRLWRALQMASPALAGIR